MTNEQIFTDLKEILHSIKPKVDLEKITLDSNFLTDIGIDSLSMLLLSLAVENKFGISFEPDVKFSKVSEVVDYISSKL